MKYIFYMLFMLIGVSLLRWQGLDARGIWGIASLFVAYTILNEQTK